MKKYYRFLATFWLVVGLGSTGSVRGQTAVNPGFNIFSTEQDIEIGQQSVKEIEKQLPLLQDPAVQRYVGQIGERLASAADGPDFPYQFKVVNVSDVNAFALPGGFMYVNRGLIEAADSEAELAGVMAHEIGHVALRHGTNQASKAYLAQAGLGLLGGLFGRGSTSDIIGAIGGFGMNATFLKFSRTAEEQADLVGAQMLSRSGYDPLAMANFFETLRDQAGRDPGRLEQFFSSHPPPADRAERIRDEARLLGTIAPASPVGNFGRIKGRLNRSPAAPSMADLAGNAQPGEAPGTDSPGGQRPSVSDIEEPSARLALFEKRDRLFRIRYPENWQPLDSNRDLGVTLIPRGGMVRDDRGANHVIFGILLNLFEPPSSGGSVRGGLFRGRGQLERNSNQLIQWVLDTNSYLRPVRGSEQELLLDGERALSVALSGQSEVTGVRERVTVISREIPGGRLIYLLFISPENRYAEVERLMPPMLSSLSLNDPALSP